jgi:transposase
MKYDAFHQDLMREVAKLYYYEDLTQDQIGEIVGLSRQKVWRVLKKAKEEGIVQIKIIEPSDKELENENQLKEKFGLKEVKITLSFQENDKILLKRVAQVAASYLRNRLDPYSTDNDTTCFLCLIDSKAILVAALTFPVASTTTSMSSRFATISKLLVTAFF